MDPLAALADRLVGQADDQELGEAAGDLDLNLDRPRLETQKRNRGDVRDHSKAPLRTLLTLAGDGR